MDAIEKRARELLASRYVGYPAEQRRIREGQLNHYESIHYIPAIIAALTPPDGYVLVPVEPTEAMIRAYLEVDGRFESARTDWAAMLAARPEVP